MVPIETATWRPVIVESPYRNDDPIVVLQNEAFVRAAIRDCLARGEAPFASHGLYTLRGIMRDWVDEERRRGMRAGFAIGELFRRRVFYTNRGISPGMVDGAKEARRLGQIIECRILPDWPGTLIDVEAWMEERGLWPMSSAR